MILSQSALTMLLFEVFRRASLVATAAFHNWHHTLEGPIGWNDAVMLPWLGRMFGTFHLPRREWPREYGGLAAPDAAALKLGAIGNSSLKVTP